MVGDTSVLNRASFSFWGLGYELIVTFIMKKILRESIHDLQDYQQKVTEGLSECLQLYKPEEEYKELGVFLGCLEALVTVHHAHHWQTLGDNFYADHELFQRLYEESYDEVDGLGEKAVGLGSPALTNYFRLHKHHYAFFKCINMGEDPATESLKAEVTFVVLGELIMKVLKEQGLMTSGLEQTIGSILEKHESHIYLLKQRVNAHKE